MAINRRQILAAGGLGALAAAFDPMRIFRNVAEAATARGGSRL